MLADPLPVAADPTVLFRVVDLGGVLANGLLGGAVARRLGFDPIGFVALALMSGLGGGLIRDTLLQVPPAALQGSSYLAVALIGAAIAYLVDLKGRWSNRILIVGDALALGAWAATGTSKALGTGNLPVTTAVLIGVVTAVGGGVVRDVLVGRVPSVFAGGPLYASVALIASLQTALFLHWHLPVVGTAVAIVTAAIITITARRRGWMLPGPANIPDLLPRRRTRGKNGSFAQSGSHDSPHDDAHNDPRDQ